MPVRSLNGLDTTVRSLNGLSDRIDYTVSLPLTMDSDYNIKLSNLTTYGSANQILKMNGSGTALEFTNESDTTYTAGTNISISAQNVISSDQQTTLTFNTGQKLKGTGSGSSIRDIAYVDSNNDIIFGDSQNNTGFSVSTGIYFLGDGTPLISNLRVFNSSGLNNIGNINNLSGNINLTNENKLNFNNDTNNSIGSQSALNGVELKGFNNVLIKTSVANKPSVNIGQTAIKCKGKISGEFLTNTTERDLLEVLTDNSIQLGDNSCELSIKGTLTTFESGNPLEIFGYIKFKNATTSSYIVGSTGNALVSINTAGDRLNIFGNGVENTALKGSNIDFEGFSSFNNNIEMVVEKKLYFDNAGLLGNSNWIKSTTDDSQNGLNIHGSAGIKLSTQSYTGEIFLNQNNVEISADLTTFDNDITTTNSDLTIDGDFTGGDCDISIDGDIKLALLSEINLNRSDTTTVYNYIRANGNIALNNSPGVGAGVGGGVEIKGYNTVLLSQTFNTSVNNAELWVHTNRVNVSATTFNYPTGGGSGSDDRIKFNEIPVDFDCLEIIKNLQVEVYDKHFIKDKDKFMDREIGIIAQDTYNKIKNQVNSDTADLFVNEIDYTIPSNFKENGDIVENQMKRVIHTDMITGETTETIEENILAVSYIRFISVLIKSQQQQQEIINQQQIIIDKLINSTSFKNFKDNI